MKGLKGNEIASEDNVDVALPAVMLPEDYNWYSATDNDHPTQEEKRYCYLH